MIQRKQDTRKMNHQGIYLKKKKKNNTFDETFRDARTMSHFLCVFLLKCTISTLKKEKKVVVFILQFAYHYE